MDGVAVACPSCGANLPDSAVSTPDLAACPYCRADVRVVTFPALWAGYIPGKAPDLVVELAEASCFYHPGKRAAVPCDHCGRFLCDLCDVALGSRHLCPSCVEGELGGAPRAGGRPALGHRRILYDRLAMALAVWPVASIVLAWATIMTAPLALYVAIRYWTAPGGLGRRPRIGLAVAAGLAALELAAWAALIYAWAAGLL